MTTATSMPPRSERPRCQCPECRRSLANRNQTHACGRHDLDSRFERKPPEIRHLFEAVVEAIERCGPVIQGRSTPKCRPILSE
jgi:hypothetical protein